MKNTLKIIGYSAGRNKDAALVTKTFAKVRVNLGKIKVFHTDRGNEHDEERAGR